MQVGSALIYFVILETFLRAESWRGKLMILILKPLDVWAYRTMFLELRLWYTVRLKK
jgi:hypothetical protein